MYKSTKISMWLLTGAMMVISMGCSDDKRQYELLPWEPEPEVNVASLAVLSVSAENGSGKNGGEGSLKVVDNDNSTKFLTNPFPTAGLDITLFFEDSERIEAYTLVSGNDADGRDPKNWTIKASTDGTTWVTLDTKTDQAWTAAERNVEKRFDFTNENAYNYYRLSISAVKNSTLFQMSEWRVIRKPH